MPGDGREIFDLGADFSASHNPNGAWRYGYQPSGASSQGPVPLDTFASGDEAESIRFWHPSSDPAVGYYPYVAGNTSSRPAVYGGAWALGAGEVAMEGGPQGQASVVEFVAPRSGTYGIEARFVGIHFGASSTDVHVLGPDVSLFSGEVLGYGGDTAFHEPEGPSPSASYSGAVRLREGGALRFVVGIGSGDGATHYSDTTALWARLEWAGP